MLLYQYEPTYVQWYTSCPATHCFLPKCNPLTFGILVQHYLRQNIVLTNAWTRTWTAHTANSLCIVLWSHCSEISDAELSGERTALSFHLVPEPAAWSGFSSILQYYSCTLQGKPVCATVHQYVVYQCGIHTRSAGSVVIDIHRSNEQYHMKSHCMIQLKHTGLCTNIVSIMCTATLPTGVHGTVNYHQIPCDFCLQFHHQFQPAGHSLRQIHRPTANIELHDCHTAMLICWHIFSVIS